jgi:hypothetical protein
LANPDPKIDWDVRADQAIEAARNMPAGSARQEALKKAGFMRRMAYLAQAINRLERPVRGKKPRKSKSDRFGEPTA